jgi:hypothetical protein
VSDTKTLPVSNWTEAVCVTMRQVFCTLCILFKFSSLFTLCSINNGPHMVETRFCLVQASINAVILWQSALFESWFTMQYQQQLALLKASPLPKTHTSNPTYRNSRGMSTCQTSPHILTPLSTLTWALLQFNPKRTLSCHPMLHYIVC